MSILYCNHLVIAIGANRPAPSPLHGDSTLYLTADHTAAAPVSLIPTSDGYVMLEVAPTGHRRAPVSFCPASKGAYGDMSIWVSSGRAIGAWRIETKEMSATLAARQADIRLWKRVETSNGHFILQTKLDPTLFICSTGSYLFLGSKELAATFSVA
jgi:hypothetical protein